MAFSGFPLDWEVKWVKQTTRSLYHNYRYVKKEELEQRNFKSKITFIVWISLTYNLNQLQKGQSLDIPQACNIKEAQCQEKYHKSISHQNYYSGEHPARCESCMLFIGLRS